MIVLRWTIPFDLHISGNEKQKFFVDTYQTNFELCLPHANKSSSFHGIYSSFWLGLDLQCTMFCNVKNLKRVAYCHETFKLPITNVLLAHLPLNGYTDFFTVSLLIGSIRFQSPPYSMFKESAEKMVGNDAFEGYAIDLISEIAQILSEYSICQFDQLWRVGTGRRIQSHLCTMCRITLAPLLVNPISLLIPVVIQRRRNRFSLGVLSVIELTPLPFTLSRLMFSPKSWPSFKTLPA